MKAKKLAALVLAGALCMSAFTGCGIDANETIATLGEQEISAGLANFMIKYQKAAYDDVYIAYYGEEVWDMTVDEEGTTFADSFKGSVMESIHELYTLKNHMSDYDVTLTDDEKKAIEEAAAAFLNDNSEEAIKELGATEEYVEEMLTLYTISYKMQDAIIADVDTEVSDEEANMRGISYITFNTDSYYDSSYNKVEYTEDEIAEFKATAEAVVADLATMTLEDAAEKHDCTVKTDAYAKDDEGFDETLLAAMDELAEGEVSDVITTDTALYIVRIDSDLDEEATAENIESIIAERENALYEEVVTGWQEDDGWTVNEKVLAKVDFHNILTLEDPAATETESVESTEK